jgi:uncharacterized protein
LRLFFATDIHGANRVFTKFLNSVSIFKADVGIVGGDIMGKKLIPVVQNSEGGWQIEYFGTKQVVPAAKATTELPQMETLLNETGFYTYRATREEVQKLMEDHAYLDQVFEKLMLQRLEQWVNLTAKKMEGTNKKIFITGGNDDLPIVDTFLRRPGPLVYCESDLVLLDQDHEMISSGYANMTPWKCPRDIPEEELEQRLEQMASKVKNTKSAVFNLHVPPIDTSLDVCPKLDVSVDPPRVLLGETTSGGSKAVRKIIEKYQPLVALHGHIHESRGVEKIGKTVCINPGSEYTEGVLRGVIVNLDREKVKSYQLTSG